MQEPVKVFISYTSDDRAAITKLCGAMRLIEQTFDTDASHAEDQADGIERFQGHICLELDSEGCSDGQDNTIQLTIPNMRCFQINSDSVGHFGKHINLQFNREQQGIDSGDLTQVTALDMYCLQIDIVPAFAEEKEMSIDPGIELFGAFIDYFLERSQISRQELANQLYTEVELINALIEGILPESEIDDDLIWDLSNALDQHPNILSIALGREIEEPYNHWDREIDRILRQGMKKH